MPGLLNAICSLLPIPNTCKSTPLEKHMAAFQLDVCCHRVRNGEEQASPNAGPLQRPRALPQREQKLAEQDNILFPAPCSPYLPSLMRLRMSSRMLARLGDFLIESSTLSIDDMTVV